MPEPAPRLAGPAGPAAQHLADLTCSSGTLLLVDASLLGLWSHDRPPTLDDRYGLEVQEHANSAVDLEIVGADAERAGAALRAQWHPTLLYDVPPAARQELERELTALCAAHGWTATLQPCSPRISHRRRVEFALAQGRGAGEVWFHGAMAAAVRCASSGSAALYGVPRETGAAEPGGSRWSRLELRLREGLTVTRREVGVIAVDEAQLCLADVDALAAWQHEASLDGRADLLFWGSRARAVADELDAPPLDDDGHFGWVDLELELAFARGRELDEAAGDDLSSLVIDYRPHSHHYLLMRQVWASEREVGQLELGGERLACVLGGADEQVFTVSLEEDAVGEILKVVVDLVS